MLSEITDSDENIGCSCNWSLFNTEQQPSTFSSFVFLLQTESSTQFIEKFAFVINQYVQALAGIVPIFNYMVSSLCKAVLV